MTYSLYWIKEDTHTDPYSEGYIGITKRDPDQRLHEHLTRKQLENVEMLVLHEGDKQSISLLEESYRHESYIGWNKSPGGLTGGRPLGIHTSGWKQTEESNRKRSEALKGEKNPMFGRKHPNTAAISKSLKGNSFAADQKYIVTEPDGTEVIVENITAYCRERGDVNQSNLVKVARGKVKQAKGYTARYYK
jgi:hypothetical protein